MNEHMWVSIALMLLALILSVIEFTVVFKLAEKKNLYRIVDIAWPISFIFMVLFSWLVFVRDVSAFQFYLLMLIVFWGLRLFFHIYLRSYGKPEDPRYEELKNAEGTTRLKKLVNIFLFQALLSWLICMPFYFYFTVSSMEINTPINITFFIVGGMIALIGFIIESVADWQLVRYKKPNQLVQDGLWKYCRHPNYLGEIMFWWGIWVMTRVFGIGYSPIINLITLISPLTITFIITKLTAPMLEKQMEKYEKWVGYKEKTPYICPIVFSKNKE